MGRQIRSDLHRTCFASKRRFVMKYLVMWILFAQVFLGTVLQADASLWNHILTYKANYRYPPDQNLQEEREWWARHYDVMVGDPDIKNIAPNSRILMYLIDLTIFQSDKYPHYGELQEWVRNNKSNLEDCFLHFSEDTEIGTPQGDMFIKGSKQKKPENRVQTFKI